MTTKQKVFEILNESYPNCVSGEALAKRLATSRTSVWKAVKALQADGIKIIAVTKTGYTLAEKFDVISEAGIKSTLCEDVFRFEIFDSAVSTNDIVKSRALSGEAEGLVVVADEQTGGRGRFERRFYSPKGCGVYMSVLLRPQVAAKDALSCTTACAVAVCRAIEKLSGRDAKIKWVNDVLVDGKKACGILTEASLSIENGGVDYVVLGIGINAYRPTNGFADEIKDVAGAVFSDRAQGNRDALIAAVLDYFYDLYNDCLVDNDYLEAYRARLSTLGQRIDVIKYDKREPAVAIGLNADCNLLVRYDDGREECLSSGEISVREKSDE